MTTPFIVYALPRSRTAWLSAFLSYGDWECYHESAMFMRSMGDVEAFLLSANVGCAETAAMHGRSLIRNIAPNIKEVVILRSLEDVINSLLKIDLSGVASYDRAVLQRGLGYCDRVLREITKDPNVLTVNYEDLKNEETCARIFEHCLPYGFDKPWWDSLKNKNIQIDTKAFLCYRFTHRPLIDAFKKHCKSELRRLCRLGVIPLKKVA